MLPQPAAATASISCVAPDGGASIELALGNVQGLAVVGALIEAGGKTLSMGREGAATVSVSQAFAGEDAIRIDFVDPNAVAVAAEIRLFRAAEGADSILAGTLRLPGSGAWPLVCTGP